MTELFIHACQSGKLEDVQKLLEDLKKINETINVKNSFGRTGLHMAVQSDKYQIVEFLLKNDSNVNVADGHSITPLHISSQYGLVRITELLLANNASTNLLDNDQNTPLYCCAFGGDTSDHVEVARLLLSADPSAIHIPGYEDIHEEGKMKKVLRTPYETAVDKCHNKIAKLISEHSNHHQS